VTSGATVAAGGAAGLRAVAVAAAGTAGARVGTLLVSLAAGVLSARALGPHDRGLLAVAVTASAIFAAGCAVGKDTANLRLAGRSPDSYRYAVRRSVGFAVGAGSGLAGLWGLAAVVAGPAVRLGLDPATFLLTLLLGPVALLAMLLGAAEVGRGGAATYNLVLVGSLGGYLAGLAALVAAGRATPATVTGAYLAGQLGAVLILLARARSGPAPAGPPPDPGRRDPGLGREFRSSAWRAYLPNLAQFGMVRAQLPVIALLAGAGAVGVYAVALALAEILLIVPVAASLVLVPSVANGAADWPAVARLARYTVAVTALGGVALAAAGPVVVPVLYGAGFAPAVPVLWALLPGLAVFAAARVAQSYLTAIDRPATIAAAAVVASLAGLGGLLVLVPRLGAAGAALATSAGYLVYASVVGRGFWRVRPGRERVRRGLPGGLRGLPGRLPAAATAAAAGVTGVTVVTVVTVAVAAGLAATGLASQQPGLLVLLAGGAGLAAAVISPSCGIYLLALAAPATQLPAPFAPDPRVLLLLGLSGLAGAGLRGRLARRDRAAGLLVAGLLGLLLAGAALGGRAETLTAAATMVTAVAVPLVCVPLVLRPGTVGRRALTGFGLAATGVGLVHAGIAVRRGGPAEITAIDPAAPNHNVWGPMLVVALAVLLARLAAPVPSRLRGWLLAAPPVALLAIGFSYSRSSYLGAAAVLLFFAVRRLARAGLWAGGVAAGAGTLGIFGFALVPGSIVDRVSHTAAPAGLDLSATVRLDLWAAAVRMFADHPVLGVGFLGFRHRLADYFLPQQTGAAAGLRLDLLAHPHNFLLTVLVETGLVGGLLLAGLLVLVGRAVWRGYRARRDWPPEAAVLAAAGVGACSLTGEPLLALPVLVPFVLLVATATRRAAG
jgi:O-antigen/teichoic acid export membrane protein/O-antigen ligase